MKNKKGTPNKLSPAVVIASIVIIVLAVFLLALRFTDRINIKPHIKSGELLTKASDEAKVSSTTKKVTDNMTNVNEIGDIALSKLALELMGDSSVGEVNVTDGSVIDRHNNNVTGGRLGKEEASVLIKDGKAVNRWTASSVISKVTAEKIKVKLDVYDKLGNKTDKKTDGILYAAVIETKPQRMSFCATSQVTNKRLTDVMSFVKGYEQTEGQEILFACTNELNMRNHDNPSKNVFIKEDGTPLGTVIRNSVIAQAGNSSLKSFVIMRDGKWSYPELVAMSTANDLINRGVVASYSYTYPVIQNSKKYYFPETGEETGVWTDHITGNGITKSLIGRISENKYVVLMSDGFGYGYLSEYMLDEFRVTDAYWGNGGVAASMYIKGYGIITPYNYSYVGDMIVIK